MATESPLGTRIKRARERKRWSQRKLADALQVNIKTIDNWENGRTEPRSSIGAIEDVLGVDLTTPPGPGDARTDDEELRERADRALSELHALREELRRRGGNGTDDRSRGDPPAA